jgi:hypothetical protein
VCSGQSSRIPHSKRMQGDTEPSRLVSASETGSHVYQARRRVGPERQTSSKRNRPRAGFSL